MLGRGRLTGWALITCMVMFLGGPLAAASPSAAAEPLGGEDAAAEAARLSVSDVAPNAPGGVQLDVVAPVSVAFRSVPATAFDVRSDAGPRVVERADRVEPSALAVAMVLDLAARDPVRRAVLSAAGQLALLLDPATAVGLVDSGPPTAAVVPVVAGSTEAVRAALVAASEAKAALDDAAAVGPPAQPALDPLAASAPLLAAETTRQRWVVAFGPAPIMPTAAADGVATTSSRGVSVSLWRADGAHPQPDWQAVVQVDDVVTLVPLIWNRLANRYRLHLAPTTDDADQLQVDLRFEDVAASATAALPGRLAGADPATTLPVTSTAAPDEAAPGAAPPSPSVSRPWVSAAAVGVCLLLTALLVWLGLRRASRLGRPPADADAPGQQVVEPIDELDSELRAAAAELAGRLRAGLVPDTPQVPDRPPPLRRAPTPPPPKRVASRSDVKAGSTGRAVPVGGRRAERVAPTDHQQVGQADSGRSVPG